MSYNKWITQYYIYYASRYFQTFSNRNLFLSPVNVIGIYAASTVVIIDIINARAGVAAVPSADSSSASTCNGIWSSHTWGRFRRVCSCSRTPAPHRFCILKLSPDRWFMNVGRHGREKFILYYLRWCWLTVVCLSLSVSADLCTTWKMCVQQKALL